MKSETLTQSLVTPKPLEIASPSTGRSGRWVGRLIGAVSVLLVAVSLSMIVVGDPYWLAGPSAVGAILLAQLVLYRFDERQLSGLIGSSLGICALLIWLVINVALHYIVGFDFSLFAAPAP